MPVTNSRRKPVRRSKARLFVPLILLVVLVSAAAGTMLRLQSRHDASLRRRLARLQQQANSMVPAAVSALTAQSAVPGTGSTATLLTAGTTPTAIMMYHDVVPRKQVNFDLTNGEFAEQMRELSDAGAHPITVQQLYDNLSQGKPLPDKPILLTFDDCTLGEFTNALPILKQYHFPAVFFVQTAYVGTTTEKQHMTWDQLREAEKTGLITVESHTVTHPEDMTKLSDDQLASELQASKAMLEEKLGHPIKFLAYPSGTCDARVSQAAQDAGYLAAFTMDRGWAASPAQSFFLPRFSPFRMKDILATWSGQSGYQPPLPRLMAMKISPLDRGVFTGGRFPVSWLAGGDLATEALDERQTVGQMALDVHAQAALNGTFFSDARVAGTNGLMIGPCYNRINMNYQPTDPSYSTRIQGRPLLLIGDQRCMVLPYTDHLGGSLTVLQQLMPDLKDAFLAGGWIVHYGKALPEREMRTWSSSDMNDPRHRAFVGIDGEGRYMLGATQDSISTIALAGILEKMGVQEAWLLDSGFSASLIWKNRVLVSGHSSLGVPSRPVPQALFLMGDPDPDAPKPPVDAPIAAGPGAATLQDALSADSTAGAAHYHHRRRRRR